MKKRNFETFLTVQLSLILILTTVFKSQGQPIQNEDPILTVRVASLPEVAAPGETIEFTLELTVAPGFHINSQKPEDELLVATSVELKENPMIKVKEVLFPKAKKKKFKFSDKPLSVYEGQVKITLKIELSEDFCGSSLELEGQVRYQACNEESCLRPSTVPFKATVKMSS